MNNLCVFSFDIINFFFVRNFVLCTVLEIWFFMVSNDARVAIQKLTIKKTSLFKKKRCYRPLNYL